MVAAGGVDLAPGAIWCAKGSGTMRILRSFLAAALLAATAIIPARAADHGDGPFASVKHSADIGDLYLFLDPNDNSRVVVILTVAGFTVTGEAVNFSVFDS